MPQRVYDPVRLRYVAATNEEMVRQALLRKMLGDLAFPRGLIAVEKELGEHGRRFDIVCYGCHFHPLHELYPLLLVECKAEDATDAAREQALGYNATIGAPFLCVAGQTQIHTLWLNADKIGHVPFLPAYRDLLEMAKKRYS
ncbi:MAG: hypothetical protein HW387_1090 [Parachlamydiales bacterium]|nr:hypothetical protein [Parachlamydiales bacterium]